MKKRTIVLIFLTIIGVITFLDRINISIASDQIMKDLDLSVTQWGWVLSAFVLSYGLMQLPLGIWGDKKGHRLVLSVIVLWWSIFTGFTGMAAGFVSLLIIRFMFGIGEAGAYPCMTGSISRWFPKSQIGKAQGFIMGATRMGGALTPFVVIPMMSSIGWRMTFVIMGAVGLIWVVAWYVWYRNSPAEMKSISALEINEIGQENRIVEKIKIPWKQILSQRQFWLILLMYWFYVWGPWFFFSWFPTYLIRGRGFSGAELSYAVAVPFLMGVLGNLAGGYLSDFFSKKYGLKWGRRIPGFGGLILASAMMLMAAQSTGKWEVFIWLSLTFGVMDLMLPSAWAICIDIGNKHSGTISGAMNTAGNLSGFLCAASLGYIISATGNYNFPLFIISGMFVVSAVLFLFIDASKPLIKV